MKYNPIKLLFIIFGFFALGLGIIGILLPVLPTTPFLLLASFCFAKGSKRFHQWFSSTKLYKKHLDGFVKNRAMTLKAKLSILVPASFMLILAFYFTPVIYGRIVIAIVFVFKYIYFFTRIRTIAAKEGIISSGKNYETAKVEEDTEL
ncbi:YbaN family protein [Anaerocolumna sp. AGMB13020]|uniref:YbaN family protein n=1 Tax=Anaerocolumna sp. AGMB13020 TaxID=3081750 RepID=UPI0029535218|nr:YbaN family protein [Anaerocolumna sp. AGMB13020]WOO38148.1 YbaN family protein [Anaerocolumna sp. AGMB13020]